MITPWMMDLLQNIILLVYGLGLTVLGLEGRVRIRGQKGKHRHGGH